MKYRNHPTVVDGVRFPSKKEATRYGQLRWLESVGEIRDLKLKTRYPIVIAGLKVCDYEDDFSYQEKTGERVVEDAKGFRTPVYRLKKKLMRACHGIEIKEV